MRAERIRMRDTGTSAIEEITAVHEREMRLYRESWRVLASDIEEEDDDDDDEDIFLELEALSPP
jgi:hypothetical protein